MSGFVQKTFHATACARALVALLDRQLDGVDVQLAVDKDFEDGMLILDPPAARVIYIDTADAAIENQRTAYSPVHRFLVPCLDTDRSSIADQAFASLYLAERARTILAGARLALHSGEISEPLTLAGVEPLATRDAGVAYAVAVEVPGTAIFPGTNSNPAPYDQEPA